MPLAMLGRRSYEVYLTHMFVVFALFHLFVAGGSPLYAVPVLFIATILMAGLLGDVVARCYSDPVNNRLRQYWGDGPNRLGQALDAKGAARSAHQLTA